MNPVLRTSSSLVPEHLRSSVVWRHNLSYLSCLVHHEDPVTIVVVLEVLGRLQALFDRNPVVFQVHLVVYVGFHHEFDMKGLVPLFRPVVPVKELGGWVRSPTRFHV
jgi:hypothetical protein